MIGSLLVAGALGFAVGFSTCLAMWRQDERLRTDLPEHYGGSSADRYCTDPTCEYRLDLGLHHRHAPTTRVYSEGLWR